MNPEETLLRMMRCPLSGQPLRRARTEELAGFPSLPTGQAALIREDGLMAYRMENGIPILIPEEAVPRAQS